MTSTAVYALVLAALGLPAVTGGVALVARGLVNRHTNDYSIAAQRAHDAELVNVRPKELTR